MGVRVNEYFGRLRSYNRRLLNDKDDFLTSPHSGYRYGFAREYPRDFSIVGLHSE